MIQGEKTELANEEGGGNQTKLQNILEELEWQAYSSAPTNE